MRARGTPYRSCKSRHGIIYSWLGSREMETRRALMSLEVAQLFWRTIYRHPIRSNVCIYHPEISAPKKLFSSVTFVRADFCVFCFCVLLALWGIIIHTYQASAVPLSYISQPWVVSWKVSLCSSGWLGTSNPSASARVAGDFMGFVLRKEPSDTPTHSWR